VFSQPVYEYMDLQIHTTMHFPYRFFGQGLEYFDEKNPPKLSYMHQFNNVNYANYLQNNAGARIIVNGAITTEFISDKKKARKSILEQITYVNNFAAEHADVFVVAKTPQEVRELVKNTHKTIIIHSIEGGKELINSQEDADFWAAQGVAFITLIHLTDCAYGGAAILPELAPNLINMEGSLHKNEEKGLTEEGKQAIVWLANAGIMTDITHMNDRTRKETLDFMASKGIPPISTHDGFKPIQHHPRALDEEDIIKIYRNHGFMSLPISGLSLQPFNPDKKYSDKIDSLPCYCEGSVDTYLFTYLAVKDFIEHCPELGYNETLAETEKVNFAIGFQSDFNGWLNHSRPKYGKDGCYEAVKDSVYEEIELQGLVHPGLLASQWRSMEKQGADLQPIKRSSEKFLQLWEYFLAHKNIYQ